MYMFSRTSVEGGVNIKIWLNIVCVVRLNETLYMCTGERERYMIGNLMFGIVLNMNTNQTKVVENES